MSVKYLPQKTEVGDNRMGSRTEPWGTPEEREAANFTAERKVRDCEATFVLWQKKQKKKNGYVCDLFFFGGGVAEFFLYEPKVCPAEKVWFDLYMRESIYIRNECYTHTKKSSSKFPAHIRFKQDSC